MRLSFHVAGIPKPKGSMRAFARKGGGRPIVTHDNKGTKPWQAAVSAAAALGYPGRECWAFDMEVPLSVTLDFVLPRPKSAPKRLQPFTKPDLDKLTRCVFDALTGIVWLDDSQVCHVTAAKRYDPGCGPGVWVTVTDEWDG